LGGIGGYLYTHFIFYQMPMKYLIALVLLTSLLFISQNALAVVPKIDSVYADSVYATNVITTDQAQSALGKPDKSFVTFGNAGLLDLMFQNHAHTMALTIKANDTLLVWGKKDLSVDSSAGQIVFYKIADDGSIQYNSKPFILGDGLNHIIVPDQDFSYIELSLAEPDPHASNHAKSYLVDAIALLQDTTPPVKSVSKNQALLVNSLSSYPNPFISSTTIHFELQTGGEVQLAVVDGLGREIDRVNAGYVESGVHEIPVALNTPGFYFVRVFVNGQPVGTPLKITSR
jgi:hypothetical protein